MMSTQTGSESTEPKPRWMVVFGLSKPTHTAQVRLEVYPANQASLKSLVVPVLPPQGLSKPSLLTEAAVPRVVTSLRMRETDHAEPPEAA
jgi:hypothetical protein